MIRRVRIFLRAIYLLWSDLFDAFSNQEFNIYLLVSMLAVSSSLIFLAKNPSFLVLTSALGTNAFVLILVPLHLVFVSFKEWGIRKKPKTRRDLWRNYLQVASWKVDKRIT